MTGWRRSSAGPWRRGSVSWRHAVKASRSRPDRTRTRPRPRKFEFDWRARPMARIPIALQLYSVRHDCAQDLPGTLKAVARMGYEGVEFAGYYGRSAQELRTMLDDLGLKCAGTHTPIPTVLPDQMESTAEFARTLGHG